MNEIYHIKTTHKFKFNLCKLQTIINNFHFTKCGQICDSFCNGRENPIKQPTANNSTPVFTRAFFVRSNRTPNQNGLLCLFSMIACDGKRESVGGVPLVAVFSPRRTLSPSREKQSDNSQNQPTELSAMIYLFNAIKRTDFNNTALNIHTFPKSIIRVQAESLEQAKRLLSRDYFAVNTGQISSKSDRTLTVQGGVYA